MLPECKREKGCYTTIFYGSDKEDEELDEMYCEICKNSYCINCHSNLLDDSYRDACKKCQEKLKNNLDQYVIPELSEMMICYLIGEDYAKTLNSEFF